MFIKVKKIDELNKRNVELARSLKRVEDDNKKLTNDNNVLLNTNNELIQGLKRIILFAECNKYNASDNFFNKIKELSNSLLETVLSKTE